MNNMNVLHNMNKEEKVRNCTCEGRGKEGKGRSRT